MAEIVTVSGPQAVEFLQGQLSQDVARLAPGEEKPAFLLEPNGKVTAWLQVRRTGDETVELTVDDGHAESVVARLNRFKLRTKADIATAGSTADYMSDLERVVAGVPKLGAELIPGETIPAEAGQHVIDASVSFTKGCYTGQELVARIDSRGGNVPRQIRALVVAGDAVPPTGAAIEDAEGKTVGHLTTVVWSEEHQAPVALGSVARSIEPPATVTVRWEGGETSARVETLPLRPPVASTP